MIAEPIRYYNKDLGLEVEEFQDCPGCHKVDHPQIAFEKVGIPYWTCNLCGLLYANPRPSRKAMQARIESQGAGISPDQGMLRRHARESVWKLDLLKGYVHPGSKVLDVGAGDGAFVRAAQDAGYDATGFEQSKSACQSAVQLLEVPMINGDLKDFSFLNNEGNVKGKEKYSLITLWDVIEHLHSPFEACMLLKEHLTDGGYIAIFTPNPKGISARLRRADWWVFGPHDHLCMFSKDALSNLLGRAGLEVVEASEIKLSDFYSARQDQFFRKAFAKIWGRVGRSVPVSALLKALNLGDWVMTIAKKSA